MGTFCVNITLGKFQTLFEVVYIQNKWLHFLILMQYRRKPTLKTLEIILIFSIKGPLII